MVWKLIDQKDGAALPRAEQSLLREMVRGVKVDFGDSLATAWTAKAEERLAAVFKRASDLFHVLHRQDARYFVDMAPAKGWARAETECARKVSPVTAEASLSSFRSHDLTLSPLSVRFDRRA